MSNNRKASISEKKHALVYTKPCQTTGERLDCVAVRSLVAVAPFVPANERRGRSPGWETE